MLTPRKNIDIEILRGIAILMVIVEHARTMTRSETSYFNLIEIAFFRFWGGVDLFFVVSGFVITLSLRRLLDAQGRERPLQIIAFWIRRVFRLFPSAWLWIAVMLLLSAVGPTAFFANFRGNMADALCSFLEIQNFHEYYCHIRQSSCGMMGPMWSLSLEEQFYLVFPVLLITVPQRAVNWVMAALIVVQFPLLRAANTTDISWFIRTDALAWGVLIARWRLGPIYSLCEPMFLRHAMARFCFLGASLTVMVSIGLIGGLAFYIGMVVMAAAGLVFAASFDRGYIVRQRRLRAVLAWIGARSYALYLINMPVYGTMKWLSWPMEWTNATAIAVTIASVGLMMLFADLNYRLLERPLQEKGRRIAARFVAERLAAPEPATVW